MAPPRGRTAATGAVARSSMRLPFAAAICRPHLATAIRCASLRFLVAAAASTATIASSSSALGCGSRTFYDKIRKKRDGSEGEGPEEMFQDFPKHPHRQRVPAALHKCNKDAVDNAEKLHGIFCAVLFLGFGALICLLNPFQRDPYDRPNGYGWTEPKMVYGSSDLAHGSNSSGGSRGESEAMVSIRGRVEDV
ncbi:hypothetical protein LSCM1_08175 [Leishmania martiniquensis]|uniref:Uncharacterized protein n=1 Tax=Leishmania martiniquensis TaxID=1580590 RepID=A0A836I497_9TRYP|nr:hypothetical protein LSCM1_08175 [Leishmania martiniquensis]